MTTLTVEQLSELIESKELFSLNKVLILVRGVPGKGKTTLVRMLEAFIFLVGGGSVAADEYPGLYKDGVYQNDRQQKSHDWCKYRVEEMMNRKLKAIAVHNTFTRKFYLKPYEDLAHKYGYNLLIVHCESNQNQSGEEYKSEHNVPQIVCDRMVETWEPYFPPTQKGITLEEISQEMSSLYTPDVLIIDWDGTWIKTKSGKVFAESPEDLKLNIDLSKVVTKSTSIFLVSNQRGIGKGIITEDFLKKRYEYFCKLIGEDGLEIHESYFATHENSSKYISAGLDWWSHKELDDVGGEKADKPNPGMLLDIIYGCELDSHFWFIGNAHTNSHSEDWQAYQEMKELDRYGRDLHYIPVELFDLAVRSL